MTINQRQKQPVPNYLEEARINIKEVDGSPTGYPSGLIFPNGSLVDNGDGTFSVSIAGGGNIATGTVSGQIPVWNNTSVQYEVGRSLAAASGNEVAYTLQYTVNKAAGNDTGLVINQTDTASPGTSLILDLQRNASSLVTFSNGGSLSLLGGLTNITANAGLTISGKTYSNTTGDVFGVRITPTYNQASGSGSNTDLLVNRTETLVNSGIQRLVDLQVGSVSQFNVSNTGEGYLKGRLREQGTFAEIHVHDASTAQSIPTGTTYTKLTCFTDNGQSSNSTSDATNDKITITKTGRYLVNGSFSFTAGTNNVTFKAAPFLDGVEQNQIHWNRKISTGADAGSASFTGIIDVTTTSLDLDVRVRHDNVASVNLTILYANLNIVYLGES